MYHDGLDFYADAGIFSTFMARREALEALHTQHIIGDLELTFDGKRA